MCIQNWDYYKIVHSLVELLTVSVRSGTRRNNEHKPTSFYYWFARSGTNYPHSCV